MTAPVLRTIGGLGAHARVYADSGLEVFPADPGSKAPLTKNGFYDATTDLETVEAWWSRWADALIAARVPPDQLLLDVDPRHGGLEVWLALKQAMGGVLPVTRAHQSGRGDLGTHFWWLRPAEKLSTRALDEWAKERGLGQQLGPNRWTAGVDLLHHTCRYTILPPSLHPETGQPYRWHDGRGLETEPAAMPALLADLLVVDEPAVTDWVRPPGTGDDSIADWYSGHASWRDLLGRHGWRVVAGDGDSEGSRWRHPEATTAHSATIRHGCLFVYTTSTAFEPTEDGRPHGYTLFRAFALLDHADDMSAAGRAAREQRDGITIDDMSWAEHNGHRNGAAPVVATSDAEEASEEPSPPPWPEMPPEAYHGIFGETVATLAPHTEADPAGILACLLTYFAAAVGAGPHFRLSGATHSARINILVVGDSARARKGSAEAMARWVMRSADPAITSERRATGLNSGEGLIEAVRDPKWTKDKKGEDVLVDEGVKDKRLLLYEPEFAGRLLTAVKRSGSTISALLRMAWDDGNLQTMSRNPLQATGAHICVFGNATIQELLLEMSARELAGGLLNRFLFVAVRSVGNLPFGGNLDDQEAERIGRRIRERLEQARCRGRLDFTEDCQQPWPVAYDALRADVPDGPLGHMTARGSVQVQRLALIYALAAGAPAIDLEHLEAAVAFWAHCRESAELVLTGDANERLTGDSDGDRLLKLLVESGRPWSVPELRVELRWSGTREASTRARLERLGLVRVGKVARSGGGRPRTMVEAR